MRTVIIVLSFFLGFSELVVAQISVKSFNELSNDLDARLDATAKKDNNGKPCAIVKVVTTEKGFSFDVGMIGVVATTYHPELAEVWVYVPEGTTKIKLSHPQLGQLSTDSGDGYFWFPQKLKSSTCYRLEITSGRVLTIVEQARIETGWLVIQSQPDTAEVYLKTNGVEEFVGSTPFQKKLPYGTYEFKIKKNLYHDEQGVVEIDRPKSVQNITLRPAFGKLRLSSVPEGAKVIIEGHNKQYTTPCVTEELQSREYSIRFMLDKYAPQTRNVTVRDGETAELQVPLDARFAKVAIQSLPGATILVNGEQKGTSRLEAELEEGVYDIEVQLAHYRPKSNQIEVIAQQPQTLTLNPEPIYGSLDIQSVPIGAKITIDGKDYGETPMTVENLLEGDHEVRLSKSGYASVVKQINIKENIATDLNEILPSGRMVAIETEQKGDEIYLDGKKVGITPLHVEVAYGEHIIEAVRNNDRINKKIYVSSESKDEVKYVLTFGLASTLKWGNVSSSQKRVLKRMIENMKQIQGGTFYMESKNKTATLNSYYIGKYEVTQGEWMAVLGTNPSYFKGENRPVTNVSWNDCQKFIRKLNELTGLNFSLPTEAEWEYAALGGDSYKYKYSGGNFVMNVAWYNENALNKTHDVGLKAPNGYGIYDMSGNVREWCLDDVLWTNRYVRGGSWNSSEIGCTILYRIIFDLNYKYSDIGLRLVVH